jgi:transcriptional regulator with XRE-family HTH domain
MKDTESSRRILKRIGSNIAQICDQKGVSQTELARKAGVDRTHLNGLLSGSRNASVLFLAKIADELNVPLASFFIEPDRLPGNASSVDADGPLT